MSELYPGEHYIRPPNEAFSVIIRVTKGCAWGRCRFCGIYEAMGVDFETRPVGDVLADIDRAAELHGEHRPHFIRFRRLWIHSRSTLHAAVAAGEFAPQTPEGTVVETRGILAGLAPGFAAEIECLHANNYVQFHGRLPEDREAILAALDGFLARPTQEREAVYAAPSRI